MHMTWLTHIPSPMFSQARAVACADERGLSIFVPKFTITLFICDIHESRIHYLVILNSSALPLKTNPAYLELISTSISTSSPTFLLSSPALHPVLTFSNLLLTPTGTSNRKLPLSPINNWFNPFYAVPLPSNINPKTSNYRELCSIHRHWLLLRPLLLILYTKKPKSFPSRTTFTNSAPNISPKSSNLTTYPTM